MHVIDNSNNEIRGGRVERDAGGDEKQLSKFAWPNVCVKGREVTNLSNISVKQGFKRD